jgi:hypothetical protein
METITTKKRLYHPPMVRSIEKEQEDDFYYELSAEDIENIQIGREQLKMGLGISNNDVFAEIEERRKRKWK